MPVRPLVHTESELKDFRLLNGKAGDGWRLDSGSRQSPARPPRCRAFIRDAAIAIG